MRGIQILNILIKSIWICQIISDNGTLEFRFVWLSFYKIVLKISENVFWEFFLIKIGTQKNLWNNFLMCFLFLIFSPFALNHYNWQNLKSLPSLWPPTQRVCLRRKKQLRGCWENQPSNTPSTTSCCCTTMNANSNHQNLDSF